MSGAWDKDPARGRGRYFHDSADDLLCNPKSAYGVLLFHAMSAPLFSIALIKLEYKNRQSLTIWKKYLILMHRLEYFYCPSFALMELRMIHVVLVLSWGICYIIWGLFFIRFDGYDSPYYGHDAVVGQRIMRRPNEFPLLSMVAMTLRK